MERQPVDILVLDLGEEGVSDDWDDWDDITTVEAVFLQEGDDEDLERTARIPPLQLGELTWRCR
jgi:hypothetical protein